MARSEKRKAMPGEPPICGYCREPAKLTKGRGVPGSPKWACRACDASVGCHPNSYIPLGTLAKKPLRLARMAAHAAFDPLWEAKMRRDHCTQNVARNAGYAWLADTLCIPPERMHIGMLDEAQCWLVRVVCRAYH